MMLTGGASFDHAEPSVPRPRRRAATMTGAALAADRTGPATAARDTAPAVADTAGAAPDRSSADTSAPAARAD
jgi:hypothetical protein